MSVCSIRVIHDPLFLAEVGREVLVAREPLTGEELQEIFQEVLPPSEILAFADELGVVERARKKDVAALVLSMIVTAGTPSGGWHADALRNYIKLKRPRVARSSFYAWFDERLEKLMARLSEHALAYCQTRELDLPGPLRTVKDWRVVDAETVKLSPALQSVYPGTGDFAAVKVHKVLSLGSGCPVRYHLSPAREHDSPHLTIDESWRGFGLLADKAYASIARLEACYEHGVAFVIRLKEGWKTKVDYIARGTRLKELTVGSELDTVLGDAVALDGKAIDANVRVGNAELAMRLVGIPTPKGYCFFLTNLSPTIGPIQVANLYRVRWEIELTNKLDKSVHRLDQSDAERSCSLKAMLHACLLSSILTALVVHRHHINTRPRGKQPRAVAPLHPMLVAKAIAAAHDVFHRCLLEDDPDEWQHMAEYVVHLGKDPNWRRKPSTLDQMRGSTISPGRPRAAKKVSKR